MRPIQQTAILNVIIMNYLITKIWDETSLKFFNKRCHWYWRRGFLVNTKWRNHAHDVSNECTTLSWICQVVLSESHYMSLSKWSVKLIPRYEKESYILVMAVFLNYFCQQKESETEECRLPKTPLIALSFAICIHGMIPYVTVIPALQIAFTLGINICASWFNRAFIKNVDLFR